jgi:hypothetical protein
MNRIMRVVWRNVCCLSILLTGTYISFCLGRSHAWFGPGNPLVAALGALCTFLILAWLLWRKGALEYVLPRITPTIAVVSFIFSALTNEAYLEMYVQPLMADIATLFPTAPLLPQTLCDLVLAIFPFTVWCWLLPSIADFLRRTLRSFSNPEKALLAASFALALCCIGLIYAQTNVF